MSKEQEAAQRLDVFVSKLVGLEQAKKNYEKIENAKRTALDEAMTSLTPEMKESIREGMTFQLVDEKGEKKEKSFDERGQEYAVDTFGATKRGHALSKSDQPKVQKAMNEIVKLTRKAIDKVKDLKKPDGTRVYPFDSEDRATRLKAQDEFATLIELEVFTPLVREGLIPETFVLDDFSEVQKLLTATFNSYRESTEEARKEEERERSDLRGKRIGQGGALDMLAGIGGKVDQMKDKMVGQVMNRLKISKEKGEKIAEKFNQTKQGISFGISLGKAGVSLMGWIPDKNGNLKAITTQEKFVKPQEFKDQVRNPGGDLSSLGEDAPQQKPMSDDALRVELAQAKRAEKITETFDMILEKTGIDLPEETMIKILDEYIDSSELYYGTEGTTLLISVIKEGIIDLAIPGDKITKMDAKLEGVSKEYEGREAAKEAVGAIDQAVAAGVLAAVGKTAAACFDGLFVNAVDLGELLGNTSPEPNGDAVAKAIAAGLRDAFISASPTLLPEDYDVFHTVGVKVYDAYLLEAPGAEFKSNILKTPDSAFAPFVEAAEKAVKSSFTTELKTKLSDDKVLKKINVKSIIPNELASLAEWEQTDEELREYERILVLMDDGGITAAEERSIEKLIAAIDKDRAVLKLVNNIGSALTGLGGGTVGIANWSLDSLTDVVAGEIVGPLKAAKLIMQMACDIKRAADRQILLAKFQQDLKRSKKSVSSLSSTIQGFVDNKVDQIYFREIELALTAVQVAAAIMGSIPEPHVLAIGKTLGLLATAAQKGSDLDEMIYNEQKLAEAWAVTKAAMDNTRDRALGLAALKLNPTLGMHAVAWAGMQKSPPDPIARMFLDSCGLNEQTLAVSGTETKVRDYLAKLLDEDREMIDSSKIKSNWAPEKYRMCTKDWYVIVSRAQRDAIPKLQPSADDKAILGMLKLTDGHQLKKVLQDAKDGKLLPEELKGRVEETKELMRWLENYVPKGTDGAVHTEMSAIVDEFIKFAAQHRRALREIGKLVKPENVDVTVKLLRDDATKFVMLFGAGKAPPHGTTTKAVEEAVECLKKRFDELAQTPFIAAHKLVAAELKTLQQYRINAEIWLREQQLMQEEPQPTIGRKGRSNSGAPKLEKVKN